jgi:hypothetical protein
MWNPDRQTLIIPMEGSEMGEELVLARNRFILRLLEQNFIRVEGPSLEDGNRILYDVWKRSRDLEDECRVRIAFDRKFLGEPNNDFARAAIQALREAKRKLHTRGGTTHGQRVLGGFTVDNEVRMGSDTA